MNKGEVVMKPIEEAWKGYREHVVPPGASATQVEECRRAFFAGAATLFHGVMKSLSPGNGVTSGDERFMIGLMEEIEEFGAALDRHVIGPSGRPS
jgi:hypothetical protein